MRQIVLSFNTMEYHTLFFKSPKPDIYNDRIDSHRPDLPDTKECLPYDSIYEEWKYG